MLATSLLAGCSSGSDEAAEGGRDPEAPTTTATDAGFVPGQPWVYDPELAYEVLFGVPSEASPEVEAYALTSAEHIEAEISRCMASRGFDYQVVPVEVLEDEVSATYDTNDRATVAEEGYGISVDPDAVPPEPEEPPSVAYTEALTGGDGCEPRARRLEGDLDKVANEYSPALVDIWNRYQADPAVREAEDRWRQCMQAEGHPFETRAHAEDELARQYALLADDPAASTEFREREIAVALADFDCAEGDRERLDQILNDRWAGFEAEHRNDILRDLRDLAER